MEKLVGSAIVKNSTPESFEEVINLLTNPDTLPLLNSNVALIDNALSGITPTSHTITYVLLL